ncbi:MAG TPA: DUF2784 family protein [Cyclobacteriaceae bacterium]
MSWFEFLDVLLFISHCVIIAINLFAWIFPKTRRLHLITTSCTLVSWILLGFFYGWGYCFLTDWHWQIKFELGEYNLPNSFITYLINNVMNLNIKTSVIDKLMLITFIPIIFISIYLNIKEPK